jgi:hypothetical protein
MNISGASQFQVGTFPDPSLSRIILLKSLLCFFSHVFLFLHLVSVFSVSRSNLHFLAISISVHLFSYLALCRVFLLLAVLWQKLNVD